MVDNPRQEPAPSASAWSIDLTSAGGPAFIVMRRAEDDAREALVEHLIAIGSVSNTTEAEQLVSEAPIESVGVIW